MPAGTLEQEEIHLSNEKWDWMAARNAKALDALFHEPSVFFHMGGAWGKEREMDIHEVSVNIIGTTAILLNRITLLAVVGSNEVTNPFMVTEVYVQQTGRW